MKITNSKKEATSFCFKLLLFVIAILNAGCKKDKIIACEAETVSASSTASLPCQKTGKLIVSFPTGNGWQFKVNNNPFQSAPIFAGLSAGNYEVFAKNENNCIYSTNVIVSEVLPGPLFAAAKSVLLAKCSPCHTGVNPQAGLDFANNCIILDVWDRIKARAIDASPGPMPPTGIIPQTDRDIIINWINAGHKYTD